MSIYSKKHSIFRIQYYSQLQTSTEGWNLPLQIRGYYVCLFYSGSFKDSFLSIFNNLIIMYFVMVSGLSCSSSLSFVDWWLYNLHPILEFLHHLYLQIFLCPILSPFFWVSNYSYVRLLFLGLPFQYGEFLKISSSYLFFSSLNAWTYLWHYTTVLVCCFHYSPFWSLFLLTNFLVSL